MAHGTDALNEGMDILDGTEDRRDGWDQINKSRDYIAQFYNAVKTWVMDLVGDLGTASQYDANTSNVPDTVILRNQNGHSAVPSPTNSAHIANRGYVDSAVGNKATLGTDVTFGHIYTPAGRSTPVTTSYTAAWINGDGRIGASASSERYKDDIQPYSAPDLLQLRARTFVMKGDPLQTVRLGLIAEEVNEIEPLLVRHEDGEPDGVHYETVAVALLVEVQRLAARVEALEARLPAEGEDAP